MKDILDQIIAHKKLELAAQKECISLSDIIDNYEQAENLHTPISMRNFLTESSSGIIAEFKRTSPSKGWVKESGTPE